MTVPSSLDRVAALPELASIPQEELDWLAAHGRLRSFDAGTVLYKDGDDIGGLFVVLSGRFSVRTDRDGVEREVRGVETGTISGSLPYSRLVKPAGYLVADGAVEILVIDEADIREMTRECFDFTAAAVHVMLDRVRVFKSHDVHHEKMAALGRLSAGLAHELNNPASAIGRSAEELDRSRAVLVGAARALGAAGLTGPRLEALEALEAAARSAAESQLSSLQRADREDELDRWLLDHGVDRDCSSPLAVTALTAADLDAAAAALSAQELVVVLRYVAASASVRTLTVDIREAAERINTLVAAVKAHTHMDRTPLVESIHLQDHLADALTLIASEARAKRVSIELTVDPDLPPVRGVVGELNHVWLNLLDNAIDAAPASGRVSVKATHERGVVTVRVIDDGPGIPAEDLRRVFEPFFTTKGVGQGPGLGLDVVQAIIRSHQGSVDIDSRPGRTELRVSLAADT